MGHILNSPGRWKQTTSTLLVNILSVHMGVIFSWIMTNYYQPEWHSSIGERGGGHMPESFEYACFRRLPFVCILAALPLGAYFSERFGRRKTLILSAIPFAICFILIALAKSFLWFLGAMAFGGVSCALQFSVIPIYVREISSNDRNGAHGVIQTMFVGIGIFLGKLVPHMWITPVLAIIHVIIIVSFVMMVVIIPESPVWFDRRKRTTYAKRVRTMLQLDDQLPPETEEDKLNEEGGNVQPTNPEPVESENIFDHPGAWKGFIVSAGLLAGQALLQINIPVVIEGTTGGLGIILSGTTDPELIPSSIINILLLIAVCSITMFLIERFGRRTLLIVSCSAIMIDLLLVSAFYHVLNLPMVYAYYIFHFVKVSVISVIVVEIIPNRVVSSVYAMSMGIFWTVTWVVAEILRSYRASIEYHIRYVWFGQAVFCALLLIFVFLRVPETKKKASAATGRVWSS